MKIYYIEDKNGNYYSHNRKKRFTRLCGKAAYDYLTSPQGKQKNFYKTTSNEDGGDELFVEIPEQLASNCRKSERRAQYIKDIAKDSQYVTISLYSGEVNENGDIIESGEELIPANDISVLDQVLLNEDLSLLKKALDSLDASERELIEALYLQEEPMSEEAYGSMIGISHQGVNKRKRRIFEKIKKFF